VYHSAEQERRQREEQLTVRIGAHTAELEASPICFGRVAD
jgi:hypothetical protein